jgi:hypothetical protein
MSNKDSSPKKLPKNALILTGVVFQMGVTIYISVLLGEWLDGIYSNGNSFYVAFTTIAGVIISIYLVIGQLNKLDS